MYIVVGLGNPGKKYEKTRHNLGFWVVDKLCFKAGEQHFKKKFQALIAETQLNQVKTLLVKPQTFMNLSGSAVAELFNFFKPSAYNFLVVLDDINLSVGQLRFKASGSSGGHKGLESIISSLGRSDFPRLRIGVGPFPAKADAAEFVLKPMTKEECLLADEATDKAVDAIKIWIEQGVEKACNFANRKKNGV